jgi:hypothetical protein
MSETIVIERGMKPPKGRARRPQLPLIELEPGDGFWVPAEKGAKWVAVQVHRHCVANGDNIITKREERNGRTGITVYRLD